AGVVAAAAAGAVLGVGPADLAGRTMLGDLGAGALGAATGAAAAGALAARERGALLALLAGLNLASERVSFSAVIDAHPLLRRLDRLGRPAGGP
ncbi:MAG: hypothetical protein ACJ74O_04780, partial [Frankiaceae bacterium]